MRSTWLIRTLLLCMAGVAQAAVAADDWQVVLLKPKPCVECTYLEEILKRNGQMQRITFADAGSGSVTATLQRRASAELSSEEREQLLALPYIDWSRWQHAAGEHAAQVLLKRDGKVVAAGGITDSVDLRDIEFPAEITSPASGIGVGSVREARANFYQQLFLRNWNLDYFYRLALDPGLATRRSLEHWLSALPPTRLPPVAKTNAFLLSTASGAVDNEVFNAIRIEEIRGILRGDLGLDASQLQVFYGSGNAYGLNAVEEREGGVRFARHGVEGAQSFNLRSLAGVFERIREKRESRNLFVLVGHGGPEGAGMWASPAPLSPDVLAQLHQRSGGDNVLVSGNCFGGVMARAMSCGFFGARPDLIASGCQADAAEVAKSKDYLKVFFGSLAGPGRDAADANHDGHVSFEEAHWYASVQGDPRNVTFSTVDALVEQYFAAHPDKLPRQMTVGTALKLAETAPAPEATAVRALAQGFTPQTSLSLVELAAQAARWTSPADGPRPLLAQLTRRVLYLQATTGTDSDLTNARQCESRSIDEFLQR